MLSKLPLLAVAVATLLQPLDAAAAPRGQKSDSPKPWIHIEVRESGKDSATVMINVPVSLARTALEMAPDDVMSEGHIKIENTDFTVSDLRKIWKELREAGDAEFVTVEEKDATVRVSRKGEKLFINVDDKGSKEQVRVEIPVILVDALLRGTGETLDVDAAVAELEKIGKGEIVRVEGPDESVRIWID